VAQESLEKELMKLLRFGGLDKENLAELVNIVVGLQREGLTRIRVFPLGIPVVDGLQVRAVLDRDKIGSILGKIILQTPRSKGISVFPYGIPNPEIFEVNVELGATREAAIR